MTRPVLSISLGQHSSAGTKPENQDFHGALQPLGPDLVTRGIAIALADGISTSNRGAEAAEIAVKTFLEDYYSTSEGWTARRAGETVIAATNSWMHTRNAQVRPREEGEDRERAGLICTLSALVLKGRTGHLFHVGDGRIARITDGRIEALTALHRVSLGGGRSHLGRALGADRNVEVDYTQVALHEGDVFVLSTDGVHEYLAAAETVQAIERSATLDAAAAELARLAAANGSSDNLTVQIARIESLPDGEIDDLLGSEIRLPPAPSLAPGMRLDGYEIVEQLHAGSRSHAFLARDLTDDAPVVIKVPSTEQRENRAALAALLLEEWVMRRLAHPNLLAAVAQHQPRTHLYSASRFAPGMPLDQWMRANSTPPIETVRRILRQVSAGLEAMHRRGILHRDLRPHNIMVDGAGHVTIIDFGSAQVEGLDEAIPRQHEDAAFAGTMQYSAPELYLGHGASVASDVYSLGVIAYQMLTGELPYGPRVSAATTPAAQRRLRYRPARELNPDLPDWLDAALAHAVAVDPARRCAEPAILIGNLANPDPRLLAFLPRPLAQRGSVRTWQVIALLLALALAAAILTRPDVSGSRPPQSAGSER